MNVIKKLFKLLFLTILIFSVVFLGYYFSVTAGIRLSPDKLRCNEKTVTLYDGAGEEIPYASSFLRQTTSAKDIPKHVKQAFVDVEDKRFYKHSGYDLKRIARAALNNVKAGGFKEGASTISQQLVKNTHLSQEKTVKRKMQEWKLTRALEKSYTKEEILERYLNTIYFGHSCFGITSAAAFYFGKAPAALTLGEGAILAGIVKSPNHYSPFKNPKACEGRKSTVLKLMENNGSITSSQREQAMREPLPASPQNQGNTDYLHFVFDELTTLSDLHGFTVGGRIEIFTYLDQPLQKQVEEILSSYEGSDRAAFVLDGQTQGFKACLSTIGNAKRLPGSLIKPLLVYAPAIEENILSPATPILDEKINFNGYKPKNYDGEYHGYVSARECLSKSLNIPAVKTLETLGVYKGAEYLRKLGLPVTTEDESLALALGGMKEGYALTDILSGYSALQNEGSYQSGSFIREIKINGRSVYKRKKNTRRVFTEETAFLTTDMLKTAAKSGTAKKLRTLPFEIAAKTGTVGTAKGNTDAYALSYTALDCAAVWLGNADNTTITHTGGGEPCNLLYQINQALEKNYAMRGVKIPPFPTCATVRKVRLDKDSYYDTHTLLLADELAPQERVFEELFKNSAIPRNKSTSFSTPSIDVPQIQIENGAVVLTFDGRFPRYYRYRIDRYDYATHTTVYEGEYLPYFTEPLEPNKNYAYTVTPIYQTREGTPIRLPTVTTKKGETPEENNGEILSKEWWEY